MHLKGHPPVTMVQVPGYTDIEVISSILSQNQFQLILAHEISAAMNWQRL